MTDYRVPDEFMPAVPEAEAPGRLTIDLGALAANWRTLAVMTDGVECGAVVKANAYGLGIEQVVPALLQAGCRTFFVALISEGKRVRALAPEATIYVLNGLLPGTPPVYSSHRLRPVLGSTEELTEWSAHLVAGGSDPGAALHVDTGLNRLGLRFDALHGLADATGGLRISLLLSHLVSAEEPDDPLNDTQIRRFSEAQNLIQADRTSLCNSSGTFLGSHPFMTLARPGFALYGGNPTPARPNPMRSVVRLEARILQLREVQSGETVGYNAQWTADGPKRIAVLGVGYADGLTRQLSATDERAGGSAIVAGERCPFAGRVSMDLITVDVTHLPEGSIRRGDYAELLGERIGVDDMAQQGRTNGYEILTSLGQRYARRYV